MHQQRGATLIVTLIILIVLTVFVVSASGLVSTDLRIAGNVQGKKLAQAAAQQAIETVLSSEAYLTAPAAHEFSVNSFTVSVDPPSCLALTAVGGYFMTSSTQSSMAPVNTQWDLRAFTTDPVTGATVDLHQGVAVRMPAGSSCP